MQNFVGRLYPVLTSIPRNPFVDPLEFTRYRAALGALFGAIQGGRATPEEVDQFAECAEQVLRLGAGYGVDVPVAWAEPADAPAAHGDALRRLVGVAAGFAWDVEAPPDENLWRLWRVANAAYRGRTRALDELEFPEDAVQRSLRMQALYGGAL